MMTSYLHHYFGDVVVKRYPAIFKGIDNDELDMIFFMLKNKMNSPLTSSAGRLFDAVSALLDICRKASYHAEPPMTLEAITDNGIKGLYPFELSTAISMKPSFEHMLSDLDNNVPVSEIAARFHNTIVDVICKSVKKISQEYGLKKVALSGGTFQNRIILEQSEKRLTADGFEIYSQSSIPSNDGGIALGQLAIAAKRRELNLF
jgi:hydrogenase maturation protein HypF